MARVDEILKFNNDFVNEGKYKEFQSTKFPTKEIAILSCMDTRLVELLPVAMNLKNGDAKIIKNAGGVVSHPFGSVMRSLLVAIYSLGVKEIYVIGHYDCGMQGLNSKAMIEKMKANGVSDDTFDMINCCGIDLDSWLKGFDDVQTSVSETVSAIKNHKLIPKNIEVYGFIIDPDTGKLEQVTC